MTSVKNEELAAVEWLDDNNPTHERNDMATIPRLQRKLLKRDQRIDGLQRRIAQLEHALAAQTLAATNLPRDITKAVQAALCNVRMIPVLGLGRSDRIVEVRIADAIKPQANPETTKASP